jgi:glycosyltransferase involved in cell wall biosynthesis
MKEIENSRVAVLIPSLQTGGAELFVIRLLKQLESRIDVLLVVMKTFDSEIDISSLRNVTLHRMNLNGKNSVLGFFPRVVSFIRIILDFNPVAVQCILYPAELLSVLLIGKFRIFWSIRGSGTPRERNIFKRLATNLNLQLSKYYPIRIIACSSAAANWAIGNGVPSSKIKVINNFSESWVNNTVSRSNLLSVYRNIEKEGIRIGMAARFDKHKGHSVLIEALLTLSQLRHIPITLTLIGRDTNKLLEDVSIRSKISNSGSLFNLELLGELHGDLKSEWFSSLDLYVLASFQLEGFPNALAEAISIGCPSISTSAGNANEMLPASLIIPSSDVITIIRFIETFLEIPPNELKILTEFARSKILQITDKESISKEYLETWMI